MVWDHTKSQVPDVTNFYCLKNDLKTLNNSSADLLPLVSRGRENLTRHSHDCIFPQTKQSGLSATSMCVYTQHAGLAQSAERQQLHWNSVEFCQVGPILHTQANLSL